MSQSAASSPYPIRPVTESELDDFFLVMEHAFHATPATPEDTAIRAGLFEFPRSLAAFDEDQVIGTAGAFSFRMTVPGGAVPAAGVSFVSVMPSHRRRGVLRSLMRRQLSDIAGGGEPIAALWASEALLYERYGYGRASWQLYFTVRRGEGALAPGAAGDGLRVRLAVPASARAALEKVYDALLPTRPGLFARSSAWWNRILNDQEASRHGAGPLRCVLVEDDSGPRGYALYAGTGRWEDETFLSDGLLSVRELIASDAAAAAALWQDLLSRDLTTEFRAGLRPVDDPLLFLLADPRRVRPVFSDGLWVRVIDGAAALSARQYSAPADVVISVRDRDLPGNSGRWRLPTAETGAAGGAPGAAGGGPGAAGGGLAAA